MTGGPDPHDGDGPLVRPPGPGQRTWTHPSEAGLAVRGLSYRRRSSALAAGVVLSGLGLLVTGLLLGTGRDGGPATATSDPMSAPERSVVTVMAVRDGALEVSVGAVLDRRGHVVVPAGAVEGADEVWVRCAGRHVEQASAVGADAEADVAVLRLRAPAGEPVSPASRVSEGLPVITVGATGDATTVDEAALGGRVRPGTDEGLALVHELDVAPTGVSNASFGPTANEWSDRLVFARDGRLVGFTVAGSSATDPGAHLVRPAVPMLSVARRLVADQD